MESLMQITQAFFLIIEVEARAADCAIAYAKQTEAIRQARSGSTVLVGVAPQTLEDGSEAKAVIMLKFPSQDALNQYWQDKEQTEIFEKHFAEADLCHVLAVEGIPEEGLPDSPAPTVANVVVPESAGPKAFMRVQGVITGDREPIMGYVGTIVPLIKERGGVYRIQALGNTVTVLKGRWEHHSLVVSEWPSAAEANDFWNCDIYQNVAIPLRKSVSDFSVLLFQQTQT